MHFHLCTRPGAPFLEAPRVEPRLREDVELLFGYEHGFFSIRPKGNPDRFNVKRHTGQVTSQPVAASLSTRWTVPGVAPIMPDPWHPQSVIDAVYNRLCVDLPTPYLGMFRDLRSFARAFFKRHFTPVPAEKFKPQEQLFEEWLESRQSYSQQRKEELRKLWIDERRMTLRKKDAKCKAFVKHESYEEPKWPRTIVSRSDAYKCFSGPYFGLIEESTYCSEFFIKHVPVEDRPAFVRRLEDLPHTGLFGSDYSSFELHAHAKMQRAVELQFYRYMLREGRGLDEVELFLKTHERVATAKQHLDNKHASFVIDACRMSGETCTSLGNGITNLVLAHFVCHRKGTKILGGVVEGDDGLFALAGQPPTVADFAECGCKVKLEPVRSVEEAGFCSMYYTASTMGPVMVRDFREKLVKFGWTSCRAGFFSEKTRNGLLAAAGFSLAAEMGSCPVLWRVAECVLSETRGVAPVVELDGYKTFTTHVKVREPDMAVREFYAHKFGVTVRQQLDLEDEISRVGLTGPLMYEACVTPDRTKMATLVRKRPAGMLIQQACDRNY